MTIQLDWDEICEIVSLQEVNPGYHDEKPKICKTVKISQKALSSGMGKSDESPI